jgi:hypothetical protein
MDNGKGREPLDRDRHWTGANPQRVAVLFGVIAVIATIGAVVSGHAAPLIGALAAGGLAWAIRTLKTEGGE